MPNPLNDIKTFKVLNDIPLLQGYNLEDGSKFYCEPAFVTQLENVLLFHKDDSQKIINELVRIVKKHRTVLFVHDFEVILVEVPQYTIFEIEDILNPIGVYPENKSRGSDYGD